MKRLLVMTSRVPWPLEKGDKLRIYHQLRAMKDEVEICLCCLSEGSVSKEDREALGEICHRLEIVELSKIKVYINLIRALFSDRPYQVHYFFQRKARRRIYKIASDFNPDHIYCQLIRGAEYVKHIHHCPKTLDYMDALNKGMERRMRGAKGFRKLFMRAESKRLVAYENLIFDYFEHHSIISAQDRDLIYHPERNRIQVIPNGVDTDFFQPRALAKKFDILFLGNMNYPPNVDGAVHLVEDILPLVKAVIPEVRVLIAGANPHRQVRALKAEGVEVSGWVEDVREAYASAKVFVAPMRIGTGLQNKILEALSMELPCITTPLAFSALHPEAKEVVGVAADASDIAAAIIHDLHHPETSQPRGKAGRSFVEAHYNWRASVQPLLEAFKA